MVTPTTTIRIPTAERDDGEMVREALLEATGKKLTHQDFYRLGKRYAVILAKKETGLSVAAVRPAHVKSTQSARKGIVYDNQ